ncbi:cation diffusion facilitator family transporter [bacterium]|nr:cation diffusion facilitator family transporter [bacterium]
MADTLPTTPVTSSEKYLLVLVSLITTGVTLTLTGYASYLSNSVTLLADFLKCLVEFLSILLAFIVVEKTRRSDISEYNYGFGKLEQLSSTAVAFAMLCSALLCLAAGIERAIHPELLQNGSFGLVLAALSVVGNGVMWLRFRTLRGPMRSPVTASQQALFFSKMLASFVVTLSLVMSFLADAFPLLLYTDSLGSILIALFLAHAAFTIASDSVGDLVDRSIDEAFQVIALKAIVHYEDSFAGFHGIKTRRVGEKKMIQIFLSLKDHLPYREVAHQLIQMRDAIEGDIPGSEVVIALHLEATSSSETSRGR